MRTATLRTAEQLDAEIRCCVAAFNAAVVETEDMLTQLGGLITESKSSAIYRDLGFASWTTYLADAVSLPNLHLAARERVVALLVSQGVSQRVIAGMLKVSAATVNADRQRTGALPEDGSVSSHGRRGYEMSFVRRHFRNKPSTSGRITIEVGEERHALLKQISEGDWVTLSEIGTEAIDVWLRLDKDEINAILSRAIKV